MTEPPIIVSRGRLLQACPDTVAPLGPIIIIIIIIIIINSVGQEEAECDSSKVLAGGPEGRISILIEISYKLEKKNTHQWR